MAISIGTQAESFGAKILQTVVSVGRLNSLCVNLQQNILDYNLNADILTFNLITLFEKTQTQKNQLERMLLELKTMDQAFISLFEKQMDCLRQKIGKFEEIGSDIFDEIFEIQKIKIDRQFEATIKKLNDHRVNPSESKFKALERSVSNLKTKVNYIPSLAERCHLHFYAFERKAIKCHGFALQRLDILVSSLAPDGLAGLCHRLRCLCKKETIDPIEKEALQKSFQGFFKTLPSEFRNSLYNEIKNKTSQLEKDAPKWGKIHCFDDMHRFENAFENVLQSYFHNLLEKNIASSAHSKFYHLIHEYAFGPPTKSQAAWVEAELPSLFTVINKFLCKNEQKENSELSSEDSSSDDIPTISFMADHTEIELDFSI